MTEDQWADLPALPEPGDSFFQIRVCLISIQKYRFLYHAGSVLYVLGECLSGLLEILIQVT